MPENLTIAAYIVAGVLFILSLGGLSAQESARRGNAFGIAGMLIAVVVTTLAHLANAGVLAAAVGIGGVVGAVLASRVEMTSMPELVAILHSFVGLAAVLVGFGSYLMPGPSGGAELALHEIEVYIGVFVGSLTFAGSVVAFGKLKGTLEASRCCCPGRHWLNAIC